MAETFRYHDSKWYEDRDAEFQAAQRRHDLWGWPAKHPGSCPKCGRPLSTHKEPGDCVRFSEESYAKTLGWDAGQRGHAKANPYQCTPDGINQWVYYEDGYQEGVAFRLGQAAYCQGWDAGHRKLDRANPHPSDIDVGSHYEAGYQDGTAGNWHRWGKIEPWECNCVLPEQSCLACRAAAREVYEEEDGGIPF